MNANKRRWLAALAACSAFAAEWSQFRGPNAAGVSEGRGLPVEVGPARNVVWKTALPAGRSSPVVAGDRIFLTAHEGEKLMTLCLNRATGEVLWQREVTAHRQEKLNKLNDRASPTPATDGSNVFAFFGDFGLVAYDAGGRELWRMPLGPFTNLHGMASSPILADGKVIQVCDQDTNAKLLAVGQRDGKVRWQVERSEVVHGFSTPVVYRPKAGPAELIVPGSYQVIGYSLETGEKLWWARGATWQVKSSPVIGGDTLYFNGWAPGGDAGEQFELPPFDTAVRHDANGDGKLSKEELPKPWWPTGSWEAIDLDDDGLLNARDWGFYRARRSAENSTFAVRLGGCGDVTGSRVLWRHRKSLPDVPCPLLYQGVLYLVRTGGILTTLNPATGEVLKQGRLTGALEGYYASPIGVDGKVYLASDGGKLTVLKAAGEWEILAVNDLGDELYATPAVAGGRMYVRAGRALYCFAKKD